MMKKSLSTNQSVQCFFSALANKLVLAFYFFIMMLPLGIGANDSTSYVTCVIQSQLGNQLYEISTALVTAWEHGAIPVFPELNKKDFNIPLNHEKIFFRLKTECPSGIEWHQHNIEGLSHGKVNCEFIEGNDHVLDFFLMNKCKHHIIANSTFSFWAAYLKNDPEQIVVAPDLYLPPRTEKFSTENGAYPIGWKVLPVKQEQANLSDIILIM